MTTRNEKQKETRRKERREKEIYEEFYPRVLAWHQGMGSKDDEDCHDLASISTRKIIDRLMNPDLEPVEKPMSFAWKVARNDRNSLIRRDCSRNEKAPMMHLHDLRNGRTSGESNDYRSFMIDRHVSTPETVVTFREVFREIEEILQRAGPEIDLAYSLYIYGMKYKEIAQLMGVYPGRVSDNCKRAEKLIMEYRAQLTRGGISLN